MNEREKELILFAIDHLHSNLNDDVEYFVREATKHEAPSGRNLDQELEWLAKDIKKELSDPTHVVVCFNGGCVEMVKSTAPNIMIHFLDFEKPDSGGSGESERQVESGRFGEAWSYTFSRICDHEITAEDVSPVQAASDARSSAIDQEWGKAEDTK